jgi:hypothetical protein
MHSRYAYASEITEKGDFRLLSVKVSMTLDLSDVETTVNWTNI